MDLQHPDITRTLRTGYPNKEKETHGNESQQNTTSLDYNKASEVSQMSLLELIKKNMQINQELESKLKEEYGVIGVRLTGGLANIQFYEVDDFVNATEGYHIDLAQEGRFLRAVTKIENIELVILLDENEEKELKELLNNE